MPLCVICPGCQARLELRDELRGKKVRCRKCETVFAAVESDDDDETAAIQSEKPPVPPRKQSVPVLASKARRHWDDDDDEDENDGRRRRRKELNTGVIVALIGGGAALMLLLIGGGALAWMLIQPSSPPAPTQARPLAPPPVNPVVKNPPNNNIPVPPVAGEPFRHVERTGGYSFVPPTGWKMVDFPGLKHQIAVGAPANGFAPNVVFVPEPFAGSLQQYVAASQNTLRLASPQLKQLGEVEWKTTEGLPGIKLITQNEQQGRLLRQNFYFLELAPKMMIVVTATALAEGADKLDPIFDAAMKSFRPEKP